MNRISLILLFTVLVFCRAPATRGQDSGLAFLRVGVDATSLARGDAGVAAEHGAYATYWNPAGLAATGRNELAISHHIWIADVRTYVAASKFRIGQKTGVGLFVTATGAGDIEAREGPGEPDGLFDAQFVSAGAAIGRAFGPVRAGVTIKYLSERIFVSSADGYAFDFGLQTTLLNGGLLLGASFQNVGKMQRLNAEATKLPTSIRVGAEVFPFRILAQYDGTPLLNTSLIVDISHSTVTELTQFHVGLSGEVLDTITARVGYISDDELRDFSTGIGLAIANLTFDYAVLPFEEGFGGPAHILSLGYSY